MAGKKGGGGGDGGKGGKGKGPKDDLTRRRDNKNLGHGQPPRDYRKDGK